MRKWYASAQIIESFRSRTRMTARSRRFSRRTTLSARKSASFWREKLDFNTRFCRNVVVSKQVKNTVAVYAFFDQQKGSGNSSITE